MSRVDLVPKDILPIIIRGLILFTFNITFYKLYGDIKYPDDFADVWMMVMICSGLIASITLMRTDPGNQQSMKKAYVFVVLSTFINANYASLGYVLYLGYQWLGY